jgi:hypothetical protein
MYGYDMKELEIFIKNEIGEGLSITSFSDRAYNLAGFLGQGISRTTLSFSKYPNIVFKVCVGEDGEVCYDAGEAEENRWNCAIEEGVAPYFAETEYLCNIKLYGNTWEEEDEYGDVIDGIDYSCSYEVPVYIQSRVDEVWCESDINDALYQSKNCLLREKKISDNLEGWISDVDNDRLFSALFIRKYGVAEYKKLAKFIEQHYIEDLHGANWGVKEGNLVIIDYAM